MAQTVLCGTDLEVQSGLYGGVSPVTYEEGTVASNGMGMRMTAARTYRNWFTQPFATGGSADTLSFKSGHAVVVSVSNFTKVTGSFTFAKLVSGTYDSDINAMFDRIYALPFDSNVTTLTRTVGTTNTSATITGTFTSADVNATITGTGIQSGSTILSQTVTQAVMSKTATATGSPTASIVQGLTQPFVYFTLQHEMDRGTNGSKLYPIANPTDTPATFIAAWQRCWNLAQARATAAGALASRVRWLVNYTGFSIASRGDTWYPGAAFVDVIGFDPYATSGSFTDANSAIWAWARGKAKPIAYPEIQYIGADSTARANWWLDASTQINALDLKVEFVIPWMATQGSNGASYYTYNYNNSASADTGGKAAPLTHAAIITTYQNLGGNQIRTAVTQALPSAPTGVTATSNTAGTQLTMTWSAPPGGDNVTGWDVYINPGVTINLHKDNQTGPIAVTPRSYTFTGLAPGTTYSVSAVAINAAGRSGFGNIFSVPTSVPGATNHAPIIDAASATPRSATPLLVDLTVTAHDPDSNPLTYLWTFTGPNNTVATFSSAIGTVTFVTPGNYTWTVGATDNGTPPLTTIQSGTFTINLNPVSFTTNYNWVLPQTGQDVRQLAPLLRDFMPDLDVKLSATANAPNTVNGVYTLVASNYDPYGISASTGTPAANQFVWAAMRLQATTITGISTLITTAQSGTGVVIALYNNAGAMLLQDDGVTAAKYSGASADAWLGSVATGSNDFTLTTPITGRTVGEFIYVGVYFPTLATFPVFPVPAGSNKANRISSALAQQRFGVATGQSTTPDPIPFASYTAASSYWFGLF